MRVAAAADATAYSPSIGPLVDIAVIARVPQDAAHAQAWLR